MPRLISPYGTTAIARLSNKIDGDKSFCAMSWRSDVKIYSISSMMGRLEIGQGRCTSSWFEVERGSEHPATFRRQLLSYISVYLQRFYSPLSCSYTICAICAKFYLTERCICYTIRPRAWYFHTIVSSRPLHLYE